ncbi:MAG: flavodoxin domain-containing protein [Paenibacillaceae bacterium]|uniref:Flavodoxin domain-containing protein n=1 Tax=Paenibacillus mellifer TaxID=2937794 RepID=A0A9X2BRR5_9BACL|nr:flavodoxin domain-containing protein [Paenibacillus mellifer]MBW4837949.1 flavodoxin domain-containing protein [Paenibacillaceae bacterium]MCK8485916.1 flavodoxin domain-containing protein [Paenibacillus mellifer]
MSTLIVYAGKYGTTEKCVKTLAAKINDPVEILNLRQEAVPDLTEFDSVIVGGSIYFGQLQQACRQFCRDHSTELMRKKLGLFICCGTFEKTEDFLDASFPADLLEHATVKAGFGGELSLKQMSLFDRFVARMVTRAARKEGRSLPAIHWDEVELFSAAINRQVV